MKLQTKIPLKQRKEQSIDYHSKLLTIGSCFSEHMGHKLELLKFSTLQNPIGILFHPKAIETFIADALERKVYTSADVFQHGGQWHSFKAHSALSNSSKAVVLECLHTALGATREALEHATHVTITLGTAWVYRHMASNEIVANCHKVPQKAFQKELLPVDTICDMLRRIVELISAVNPKATLIFTVSPVRHLKDGFVENMQSKSHLITAIHKVLEHKKQASPLVLSYFPAYEIMMDELRDYRFYKADMVHPSALAIDYIWERFVAVWMTDATRLTMGKVAEIQKRLLHKAFHPESEAHQKFLKQTAKEIQMLHKTYPFIKF